MVAAICLPPPASVPVRRIRLRREGGEEEEKEEEKEGKEEKEEEKEEVEVQGGTNIRRWAMVYAPVV